MALIFKLGQEIISTQFGLGRIVSIEKLHELGNDFYVIESHSNKLKVFVDTYRAQSLRQIGTQSSLRQLMSSLNKRLEHRIFSTKKDRINYYKDQSSNANAEGMAIALKEISSYKDLGKVEKSIIEKMIDTLSVELTTAFAIQEEKSKEVIKKALNGEVFEL